MATKDIVFYEGLSPFNGEPIIGIITGLSRKSRNPKTGEMLQAWILPRDINPLDAVKNGQDASVCGVCKYRNNGCYVNIAFAPNQVWKKYKSGGYDSVLPSEAAELIRGKVIRIGAYGDPAMIPYEAWKPIIDAAKGHTGYTHQWNAKWINPLLSTFLMASVDSKEEYELAKENVWRCFMVALKGKKGLVQCPASEEKGKKTTCQNCKLCSGTTCRSKKDIFILPHGTKKKAAINTLVKSASPSLF